MANLYTSQSISGYNANPPSDDGSQTSNNLITWAKHKEKLGDPVKSLSEAINTELVSAFGKVMFNGSRSTSSTETIAASDQGKLILASGTITLTLPDASDNQPMAVVVLNDGAGTVTLDASAGDTIDGLTSLAANEAAVVVTVSSTKWYALPWTEQVSTVGEQQMFVPASNWTPRITNGPAFSLTETTTNDHMVDSVDFDAATEETAEWDVVLPKRYDGGTVTFIPVWTADSSSGGVVFGFSGRAFANDDAIDQALGSEVTSTDTLIATGDVHFGPETNAITIAGSPAGETTLCKFAVARKVSDGSDTLGADARFLGAILTFTSDAATDA